MLLLFGIAKQGVSYVVSVELRSVCEELRKSVVSRHYSCSHKTTQAFVQEKKVTIYVFGSFFPALTRTIGQI